MKNFKKIIAILLVIVCFSSFIFPTSATTSDNTVFYADIESWDGASGAGKTAVGGSFRIFGDGTYSLGTDTDGNKYIKCTATSSAGNSYIPLTINNSVDDMYVFSVDFMYEELGATKNTSTPAMNLIQLCSSSPKEWYNIINVASDGALYGFKGTKYSDSEKYTVKTLSADTWYTVALYLDITTGNYLVSVNGEFAPAVFNIFASATAYDVTSITVSEYRIGCRNEATSGTHTYGLDNIKMENCDVTEIYDSRIQTSTLSAVRMKTESGLRYTTTIDKDFYASLVEGFGEDNVSVGTVITPKKYTTDCGGVTINKLETLTYTTKYLNVTASEWFEEGTDTYTFAGSVTSIRENHYTLDYCAVGYCEVKFGETTYRFYSEAYATSNVADIATKAIDDRSTVKKEGYMNSINDGNANGEYSPYTTTQMDILKSFIK